MEGLYGKERLEADETDVEMLQDLQALPETSFRIQPEQEADDIVMKIDHKNKKSTHETMTDEDIEALYPRSESQEAADLAEALATSTVVTKKFDIAVSSSSACSSSSSNELGEHSSEGWLRQKDHTIDGSFIEQEERTVKQKGPTADVFNVAGCSSTEERKRKVRKKQVRQLTQERCWRPMFRFSTHDEKDMQHKKIDGFLKKT